MLCSDEGKVRKILKVEPLMDGSGHLFNLSNPLSSWTFEILFYPFYFYFPAIFKLLGYYEIFDWLSLLYFVWTAESLHSEQYFKLISPDLIT